MVKNEMNNYGWFYQSLREIEKFWFHVHISFIYNFLVSYDLAQMTIFLSA